MSFERIKDPCLSGIVEKLKTEFQPTKIFLFGSHSKNIATESSDYDLVVVVKDSKLNQVQRSAKAIEITWTLSGADIFVYTENEFNQLVNKYGSVAYTAFNEGQLLDV